MSMTPPLEEAPIKVKRNPATVALVLIFGVGAACLVTMVVTVALVLPMFYRHRQAQSRQLGVTRMKTVATATLQYAVDFDDHLPVADRWMDAVSAYVPTVSSRDFRSPDLGVLRRGFGVAFMKPLSSAKVHTVADPSKRVLVFDSTLLVRNAASGLETEPKPPRFGDGDTGGNVFGFLDGHASMITPTEEVNLR